MYGSLRSKHRQTKKMCNSDSVTMGSRRASEEISTAMDTYIYSSLLGMRIGSLNSGCPHHQWNVLPFNNVYRSLKITHSLATLHIFPVCLVFHCPTWTFQTLLLTSPTTHFSLPCPSKWLCLSFIGGGGSTTSSNDTHTNSSVSLFICNSSTSTPHRV